MSPFPWITVRAERAEADGRHVQFADDSTGGVGKSCGVRGDLSVTCQQCGQMRFCLSSSQRHWESSQGAAQDVCAYGQPGVLYSNGWGLALPP
jgi:hypothetical protein